MKKYSEWCKGKAEQNGTHKVKQKSKQMEICNMRNIMGPKFEV